MPPETDMQKLLRLLDQAAHLARQFSRRDSRPFASADEFHVALADRIARLKSGEISQLHYLYAWFFPTSRWDDITGKDGAELANQINELLEEVIPKINGTASPQQGGRPP